MVGTLANPEHRSPLKHSIYSHIFWVGPLVGYDDRVLVRIVAYVPYRPYQHADAQKGEVHSLVGVRTVLYPISVSARIEDLKM